MPREERFLTFNADEIMEAVRLGCQQDNQPLPPQGDLQKLDSQERGEKTRILLQIAENEFNTNRIAYTSDFFVLSLILLCRQIGIPIPQAGSKSLRVEENKIIMKIEI